MVSDLKWASLTGSCCQIGFLRIYTERRMLEGEQKRQPRAAARRGDWGAGANMRAAKNAPSLPPRRECVVERALAGGAFFDRDDGAALVDVDQRHIEP